MGENLELYKNATLRLKDIGNALEFRDWAKSTHPKIYAEFMSTSKTGKGFPRYK